jgi:hypothetical protein
VRFSDGRRTVGPNHGAEREWPRHAVTFCHHAARVTLPLPARPGSRRMVSPRPARHRALPSPCALCQLPRHRAPRLASRAPEPHRHRKNGTAETTNVWPLAALSENCVRFQTMVRL